MSKATINDVAALAGVSIKTVSRVVNGEPNVCDVTRERVAAAIAQLNYNPNQSARRLASHCSYLIGLLYSNPSASYVINAQQGALAVCAQERFDLLIHPCDYAANDLTEDIQALLLRSHLDGVVLTPPLSDNRQLLQLLNDKNVPYVSIAPADVDNVLRVFCDDRQAAREMTEKLISFGHRQIAFIQGHPDHRSSERRLLGYRDALRAHNIVEQAEWIKQGYFTFESGNSAACQLLAMATPPTAIFAANDEMACGAMVAAHSRGVSIPQQISICGFDNIPVAATSWPALTTIHQPVEAMVAKATEMLIRRIRGEMVEQTWCQLPFELVVRESTASIVA